MGAQAWPAAMALDAGLWRPSAECGGSASLCLSYHNPLSSRTCARVGGGKGKPREDPRLNLRSARGERRSGCELRAQALETTLTDSSPSSSSPAVSAEEKSLGDITKDDFPILDQVIRGVRTYVSPDKYARERPDFELHFKKSCSLQAVLRVSLWFSISSPEAMKFLDDDERLHRCIQMINSKRLVYFDNAATSQKPTSVLKALSGYYEGYNSNVHRGIHTLSSKATDQYEIARSRVAKFINAPSHANVVFTRNASEAINLVANTWGLASMRRGDEIVLSLAEHHSNLVPWQLLAAKVGVNLKFARLTEDERVDVAELKELITNRTKLVAVHHVSNTLASINPVEDIVNWAHKYGAKVLVDACQSVPHMPVDVQALDVDFLVASSHKMCGPTGIGFLYGKSDILEEMPPWMGGGEMISEVFLDHSTFASPPARFEAGTPAIGEAIGLGAAVNYLSNIGMDKIHAYEMELSKYLYESLVRVPGVKIYGPPPGAKGEDRVALCSFNVEDIHATDIATILDMEHGVAVRSGHHCTQPLHRQLNINASARASLYFYNTKAEVDAFIEGLKDAIDFFSSMR